MGLKGIKVTTNIEHVLYIRPYTPNHWQVRVSGNTILHVMLTKYHTTFTCNANLFPFPCREVQKAVNKVRTLYSRWQELLNDPLKAGRDEYNWTTNELKNNIRSIEWDLEDLDETIGIVEANPRKFNMDMSELSKRKLFVRQTRDDINSIKEHLNSPQAVTRVENSTRQVRTSL